MFTGDGVVTFEALTPAADIYSLAKSIYTLLTHEAPRFYANQQITDLPISVRDIEWAPELVRVLKKATAGEPSLRHQSVDEFWTDLEAVRKIAAEAETVTHVRPKLHATPQAHVARGYTPLAPQKPEFDTSRELKLRHPLIPPKQAIRVDLEPKDDNAHRMQRVEDLWPNAVPPQPQPDVHKTWTPDVIEAPKKQHPFLKRLAAFAIVLALLVGALYATSVYLRRIEIPSIAGVFTDKTGRANTDINLRPDPGVNNDPIGLVTKDSRLRIVKTQNNWYQVDVLEQGRERNPPLATTRGWLNGRYVDLD